MDPAICAARPRLTFLSLGGRGQRRLKIRHFEHGPASAYARQPNTIGTEAPHPVIPRLDRGIQNSCSAVPQFIVKSTL